MDIQNNRSIVREIKLIGKYQHCYRIGDVSQRNLYKYMDFVSAIKALEGGLYIVEPSKWKDKFEGRFYCAIYDTVDTSNYNPEKVYACCFSQKRTNEAAWKVYVDGKIN